MGRHQARTPGSAERRGRRRRPRSTTQVRCPQPRHFERTIWSNGSRQIGNRQVRLYICSPGEQDHHQFSTTEVGEFLVVLRTPSPACPKHKGSKVVRDGSYGKKGDSNRRQRYACQHKGFCNETCRAVCKGEHDGPCVFACPPTWCKEHPVKGTCPRKCPPGCAREHDGPCRRLCIRACRGEHIFTPDLARAHIDANEWCDHCEQPKSVHHGDAAVARKHRFPLRVVARGLEHLALGGTYGEVGVESLRAIHQRPDGSRRKKTQPKEATEAEVEAPTGAEAVEQHDDPDDKLLASIAAEARSRSRLPVHPSIAAIESRRAWRIAANWVEAFSPVIWDPLDARLREAARAERKRLDALFDAGKPLEQPQIIVIDDVPVWSRDRKAKRRQGGYFVLVVGEVGWEHLDFPRPDQYEWEPRLKLRLVRAFARSNRQAWRLVFTELGYAPDFIIADAGTGLKSAIAAHFDAERTHYIPSLWHLRQAVLRAFGQTGKRKRKDLDLVAHARLLNRESGVFLDEASWAAWWSSLRTLIERKQMSVEKVESLRALYEPPYLAVLPHLAANPALQLSNGGLEQDIDATVKGALKKRTQFANIERTNGLFDLVVANEHGAFADLKAVAGQLRADAIRRRDDQGRGGYTVSLRTIDDPQDPEGKPYSSLRDPNLLADLARAKGIR